MLKITGVALLVLWLLVLTGWEYRTWQMQPPAPSGLNLYRLELCRDALARRRQLEDNYFETLGSSGRPALIHATSDGPVRELVLSIEASTENAINRYCGD